MTHAVILSFLCIAIFFRLIKYSEKINSNVVVPLRIALSLGKIATHEGISFCFGRIDRIKINKNTTIEIIKINRL